MDEQVGKTAVTRQQLNELDGDFNHENCNHGFLPSHPYYAVVGEMKPETRFRRLLAMPVWDWSREDYVEMPPVIPMDWKVGDPMPEAWVPPGQLDLFKP